VVDLNVIKITPRDEDVLRLLGGRGVVTKEIGRQLNISPSTVKQPLRTLLFCAPASSRATSA
jgi:DNA-binding NarL/FixJ family response regulator